MYQQRSFLEDEEKALQPFSEECVEIFIFLIMKDIQLITR
jgi:hypothetical protein